MTLGTRLRTRMAFRVPGAQSPDSVGRDSVSTIDALGKQVGELSDLVVQGRWEAAWQELQGGLVSWAVDLAPTAVRALIVGIMVLSQFGLNVTAALAGLGIAGLAIKFAAKDTLENFISGLTILMDRPFRVGDVEVPVRLEYTERVRQALRDAGIEIPFPHMQLFVDGAKGLEEVLEGIGGGRSA